MYGDEERQGTRAIQAGTLGKETGGQSIAQGPRNECDSPSPSFASGRIGPIRKRIALAFREGDIAMRRLHAAQTAQRVLDQHPEFAELLDALNEF